MVVARNPLCLSDFLILDRWFEHHALVKLVDDTALYFLPGRLIFGEMKAPGLFQFRFSLFDFIVRDQDIGGTFPQVDANPVPSSQKREASPRSGLRRSVEY